MSVIDSLITDRTSTDVSRVHVLNAKWIQNAEGIPVWTGTIEELAEWNAGLKGAYNDVDLNRVGAAVVYLAGELNSIGFNLQLVPKTNWTGEDVPAEAQMDDYLHQIATIRAALVPFPDTSAVPDDMAYLTHQEANDIEQILRDVETLINNLKAAWFYCGEIYCGEVLP